MRASSTRWRRYLPTGAHAIASVPFAPVGGARVTGSLNEYFDAYSTNEIPFGRTRADGTGEEYFEAQTAREAQGLGCGDASMSSDGKHACWLVVVPRGGRGGRRRPRRRSATRWSPRR